MTHPLITGLAVAEGLPRAEIELCRAHRDEVLPLFLDLLHRATSGDLTVEEYDALFFVVHLLGEFADPAACRPLLAFLGSDPVQVEDILGDAITETLPCILVSVYDGDHAALEAFISDPQIDHYVRVAVLAAWLYHALAGHIERSHAEAFLHDFSLPEDEEHEALWAQWLVAVAYLGLTDLTERAREVCDRDQVGPVIMDFDGYERLLAQVQAADDRLAVLAKVDHCFPFTDTIATLSQWHGFSDAYRHEQRQREMAARSGGTVTNPHRHVGRNDPCPCGSGKKFKKCCGG